MLPFPPVVGEINRFDKLPELPGRFLLGADFSNDLRYRFPRITLRHVLDEANYLAFLDAAFVPEGSPAATLFSDTSCGVPLPLHKFYLLCALATASFWRW